MISLIPIKVYFFINNIYNHLLFTIFFPVLSLSKLDNFSNSLFVVPLYRANKPILRDLFSSFDNNTDIKALNYRLFSNPLFVIY